MKTAAIDIQGFPLENDFVVKELAIRIGLQINHYLFKPPVPYVNLTEKEKKTVNYVERNIHGLRYSSGDVEYTELKNILWRCLKNVDCIYVKGNQKYSILKSIIDQWNLKRISLVNIERFSNSKMETTTPACLNHQEGHFRCALNCVNIVYHFINKERNHFYDFYSFIFLLIILITIFSKRIISDITVKHIKTNIFLISSLEPS